MFVHFENSDPNIPIFVLNHGKLVFLCYVVESEESNKKVEVQLYHKYA